MDFSLVHALLLLSILSHHSPACFLAWMDSLNPPPPAPPSPSLLQCQRFPDTRKTSFEVKTPSICIANGAISLALLSSHYLPILLPAVKSGAKRI
jgi:hypothetical protein